MVSLVFIVYLSPREVQFKYEFQKGKPWLHENLVAPFDFAILKSETALKEEYDISSRCIPFKQEKIADTCIYCGKETDTLVYWGKAY